jgi:FKBP-type peptidyl-prolyl cis-trans isomerase
MRVGGRRIVLVPGSLAFGDNPPASLGLKPNESLVYVIDMVSSP